MFKRILVAVDGSEIAERAMQQGLDVARQLGATVVGFVVESMPPLPSMGAHMPTYRREAREHEAQGDTHAYKVLAFFSEQAAKAEVPFEGHHERSDDAARAIAETADRLDVDMVVMLTHGRGPFGELLFGSHSKKLLSLTKKPVLIFH